MLNLDQLNSCDRTRLGLTQKLPTSLNLSNRQDEAVRWAALPT
ncbi:hypothetical protein [Nostoc sp.]